MSASTPVIYLLHGEDEYAIAQQLNDLEAKLGDAATASMNTTQLDGASSNAEQVFSVASSLPFLAKRRLVILTNPLARLSNPAAQSKFREQLAKVPPTTALVLVEYRLLTSDKDRSKNKLHWLEKWALENPERALLKAYPQPKGGALVERIQELARKEGGQISPNAAALLGDLVDGDPRLAHQEIHKLLAYVAYKRPVEIDDVQAVTADAGQGDIFALVDSLGGRDGRKAMGMLHRLLEHQEYYAVFGMVVRQFRLLLQVRELLDQGAQRDEVIRQLRLQPFVADKLIGQARRFGLPDLELIYHRLLEVDEAVKTGRSSEALALEMFVSSLTT
jgi:DNA polymerase-3 subunit delta